MSHMTYVTRDKIVTSPLYYYHYYSLMILWSLRNSYTTTYIRTTTYMNYTYMQQVEDVVVYSDGYY